MRPTLFSGTEFNAFLKICFLLDFRQFLEATPLLAQRSKEVGEREEGHG